MTNSNVSSIFSVDDDREIVTLYLLTGANCRKVPQSSLSHEIYLSEQQVCKHFDCEDNSLTEFIQRTGALSIELGRDVVIHLGEARSIAYSCSDAKEGFGPFEELFHICDTIINGGKTSEQLGAETSHQSLRSSLIAP